MESFSQSCSLSQPRVVLVIGYQRSGTSLLTKGLETMGISLGNKFIPANSYNEKGFWEDAEFHALNLKILNSFEDRAPIILSISEEEAETLCKKGFLKEALDWLLPKLSPSQPIGLKYPRATVLLPFWKKVFRDAGVDLSFVIALRHPLSALAYQQQHKTQHPEECLWIWISYLLMCLEQSEGYQRVLVDYDELLANPTNQMKRVASALQYELNLPLLHDYSHHFVDPALRRFRREQAKELPRSLWKNFALEIYEKLFSMVKEEASFLDIQPSLNKWNTQLELIKPLLKLEEVKELEIFFLRTRNQKLRERNTEQLRVLLTLNKKILEQSRRMVNYSHFDFLPKRSAEGF